MNHLAGRYPRLALLAIFISLALASGAGRKWG
jgi:hypothetical protein